MTVLRLLWLETPSPSPSPVDPNLVTPGVLGFVATLLLILATIVLLFSMNRRIRRVNRRAEIAAQLDAEEAAARDEGDAPQP